MELQCDPSELVRPSLSLRVSLRAGKGRTSQAAAADSGMRTFSAQTAQMSKLHGAQRYVVDPEGRSRPQRSHE